MLIACWSIKGGVGTTVVAAALAIALARAAPAPSGGALLVDLAGDLPVALGLPPPPAIATGIADWLAAAPDVPPDGLVRIEARAGPGLALVPRGFGPLQPGPGADALTALLVDDPRPVVADCGRLDACTDAALEVAAGATRSLLVLRPCVLGLARARDAPLQPSGVVLVTEPGRAITAKEVERVVGAPVTCRVRVTETVARAVDAGLLNSHLPRTLVRDLRHAAFS